MTRGQKIHSFLVVGSNLLCMLFGCAAIAPQARAQAAVEAAGATSVSAGAASSVKTIQMPKIPSAPATPAGQAASPHIVGSPSASPSVEANRQALESKAGTDGAKLLLRSTPSQAQVWINNQDVGNTPLLLIVPPGKYVVEMRGTRQETGKQELALLPRETREVAIKLDLHYPSRVVAAQK